MSKEGDSSVTTKKVLRVVGFLDSPVFQQCTEAAQYLSKEYETRFDVKVEKIFGYEFERKREELSHHDPTISTEDVLVIEDSTGNIQTGRHFVSETLEKTNFKLFDLPDSDPHSYRSLAHKNLLSFLKSSGSTFCWMLIRMGGMVQGRIVFQLHSQELPRTCANFLHLCRGDLPDAVDEKGNTVKLSYKGSSFYRIVKGGWVQGGDISGRNGNGGYSIYGPSFPDESFNVKHNDVGILGMANDGEHTNASSFYITMGRSSWMDQKYVAFGRVVEGLNHVRAIHNVDVKHNQAPQIPVIIDDCGSISLD